MKNNTTPPQEKLLSSSYPQSYTSNIDDMPPVTIEKRKRGRPRKIQGSVPDPQHKPQSSKLQKRSNPKRTNKSESQHGEVSDQKVFLKEIGDSRINEFDSSFTVSDQISPVVSSVTRPRRKRGACQPMKSTEQLQSKPTGRKRNIEPIYIKSDQNSNPDQNNKSKNNSDAEGPPIKKRRGRPPKSAQDITRSGVLQNIEKNISEEKMKKNWTVMTESVQNEVIKLLTDATLEIVNKFSKGKSQRDVQRLLSTVNDKIKKKIPRILVPKSTKVRYFKYESIASQNAFLKASLSATLDQVDVLKKTIEDEKIDLAKQKHYLHELKNNVQTKRSDMMSTTKNVERKLLNRTETSQLRMTQGGGFYDDAESINYIGNYKNQSGTMNNNFISSGVSRNHKIPGAWLPQLDGVLGELSDGLSKFQQGAHGGEPLMKKINDFGHNCAVLVDD